MGASFVYENKKTLSSYYKKIFLVEIKCSALIGYLIYFLSKIFFMLKLSFKPFYFHLTRYLFFDDFKSFLNCQRKYFSSTFSEPRFVSA